MTARVYSYLRFSDPKQAAGSSAERQIDYAAKWAQAHGLVLDESLSLRDEGLSAYHQRHVTQGALGGFLRAIDEGKIPAGSVLIVESLDRLSRAEAIVAQGQLAQIINAGITVVTSSDGREYNRDSLKANPMELIFSLIVMIRAHEESDTKSKRVKAALRRQCEGWIAGTWRGVVRNGKDPHWVQLHQGRFELVPDKAEAIRRALDLFRNGIGHYRIAQRMQEESNPYTNNVHSLQLYRIVRNRALVGEKTISVDGEEYRLPGYYPPLMDEATWQELQVTIDGRSRVKGRIGDIPGIITGIGVAHCGYCGAAVVAQNIMGRKRQEDGRPQNGHRRIHCTCVATCPAGGSASVVPIEQAIMTYCSDQMNLSALLDAGDAEQPWRSALAGHRARIAEIEKQLERVTEAMLAGEDEGATPLVFVRKARDLEEQLAKEKASADNAERQLVASRKPEEGAAAEAWQKLAKGVEDLDYDARMAARQLIRDTFSRIAIYIRGVDPTRKKREMTIVLVAKGGGSRVLTIPRLFGRRNEPESDQRDSGDV